MGLADEGFGVLGRPLDLLGRDGSLWDDTGCITDGIGMTVASGNEFG